MVVNPEGQNVSSEPDLPEADLRSTAETWRGEASGVGDLPVPAEPAGWSDTLSGADGPRYWDRVLSSEQARIRRNGRVATVVLVEIAGHDALVDRWGRDVAESTFVKLARTLVREVRSSDYIARIERTRFAVLLPETDEVAAINFVERARAACDAELGMAGEVLRIGIGWSSLSAQDDSSTILDKVVQRLAADLAASG